MTVHWLWLLVAFMSGYLFRIAHAQAIAKRKQQENLRSGLEHAMSTWTRKDDT